MLNENNKQENKTHNNLKKTRRCLKKKQKQKHKNDNDGNSF